jgi:hypothetical protein
MNRNQIPDKIKGIDNVLEQLLGDGSSVLQIQVLKNVHGRIGLQTSRENDIYA